MIVCLAAAVLRKFRKFLSDYGLMGVLASVSLSLLVFISNAPLFSASLPLPPFLPPLFPSSLPLSEIAGRRETGAASPEKSACRHRLAGARAFLFPRCSVLGGRCNVGAGAELDWKGDWELREARIVV